MEALLWMFTHVMIIGTFQQETLHVHMILCLVVLYNVVAQIVKVQAIVHQTTPAVLKVMSVFVRILLLPAGRIVMRITGVRVLSPVAAAPRPMTVEIVKPAIPSRAVHPAVPARTAGRGTAATGRAVLPMPGRLWLRL